MKAWAEGDIGEVFVQARLCESPKAEQHAEKDQTEARIQLSAFGPGPRTFAVRKLNLNPESKRMASAALGHITLNTTSSISMGSQLTLCFQGILTA